MKKHLLVFAFLAIGLSKIFAQAELETTYTNWFSLQKVTTPSLSTSGLAKLSDMPVNYYTGSPVISIPLYTINTGRMTWPITLNYNTSGIKVSDNSGNVGLGWTVNAEGAIIQNVLGKKDDGSYQTDGLNYTTAAILPNTHDNAVLLNNLASQITDGVPDMYIYNFGPYSGKFIDANGIKLLPKKDLVVSTYIDANNQKNWKIIAEDGKVYYFAAMETTVNRSNSSAPSSNNWFLTKVVDPNGIDSLVFQYDDTYIENDIARDYVMDTWRDTIGASNWSVDMAPNDPAILGHLTSYSQRTFGKQLKSILFNNGSVEYDIAYNDRQDLATTGSSTFNVPRLKNIFIKDQSGTVIRTIHFEQDYYQTPNVSTIDGKRLRLTSVSFVPQVTDLNTEAEQKYAFQYEASNLPVKSSNSIDHWGYYNGKDNTTLIPTIHYKGMDYYGADRNTYPNYAIKGMLQKITYPTGGSANFVWETHSYNTASYPVLTYVDKNKNASVISSHNDNSESSFSSDPFTIPDNDSFNNLDANLTVSAGYPSGTNSQTITHAGSKGMVYRVDNNNVLTLISTINFQYSPTGNYKATESVQLMRGNTYIVKVSTTGPVGCSVNATLNMQWPAVDYTGGGINYVGGCRVKSITYHDQTGSPDQVKSFSYPDVQVFRFPTYYTPVYQYLNGTDLTAGPGITCYWFEDLGLMMSSSSLNNIGAGTNVGYPYVKEYNGSAGGFTQYLFTSFDGLPGEIDAAWRRGEPLGTKIYDNNGALIKETINHVKRVTSETYAGHTARDMGIHPCFSVNSVPSPFPAHYDQKTYAFPVDWIYTDTVENIDYETGIHNLSISYYDNPQHQLVTRKVGFESDGTQITSYFKYPTDFTIGTTTNYSALDGLKMLQDKHMDNMLVEQYTQKQIPNASGTPILITTSADVNNFKRANTTSSGVSSVVLLASQSSLDASAEGANYSSMSISNNNINLDSRVTEKMLIKEYDSDMNLAEVITNKTSGLGCLWGIKNRVKIATVAENDTSVAMAYTSFEGFEAGNWTITGSGISDDDQLTGTNSLNLSANPTLKINFPSSGAWNSLPGMNSAEAGSSVTLNGRFIVSYWSKGGSVLVNGTSPTKTGMTAKGWTYHEHTLVNPVGSISITGTGRIDEVRFYRESSLMKSYTVNPLIGITSYDDENGHITFYDYNSMGQLEYERDIFGNIIKYYKYHYHN